MTQHNAQQTNEAITRIGDVQQLAGGNITGASAGKVSSHLLGPKELMLCWDKKVRPRQGMATNPT